MDIEPFGRLLIFLGVILLVLGAALLAISRLPGLDRIGSLPGDIRIQGENFACFAPITSMILLSILLSIVLNIIVRLINR